jgi:hypothetical protein
MRHRAGVQCQRPMECQMECEMGKARTEALKALKELHRLPVDMSRTPGELFDPESAHGETITDRAAALQAASNLEQFLERAVAARLVKLNSEEKDGIFGSDRDAPLSSLSSKIKIGYALGAYDRPFRDDLDCIRHIRNAFAHVNRHINFDSPAIAGACEQLKVPKWPRYVDADKEATPKHRFLFTCLIRGMGLLASTSGAKPPLIFEPDALPHKPE